MTNRKERRLRQRLIKQGLTENEIEKIIKAQKKKSIVKVVAVSALVGVIIISGAVILVKKMKEDNSSPITEQEKEAKEADEKLKDEIKKDTPDKKPEDIVIPDDASEEEKEKLQEEKHYWEITSNLKSCVENCIKQQVQKRIDNHENINNIEDCLKNLVSVRRINNIYKYDNNSLIIDCDYLYNEVFNDNSYLRQINASLVLENKSEELNISDINSLIDFINDSNTNAGLDVSYTQKDVSNLNEFYENHIKNFVFEDYIQQGYSVSLDKITCGDYMNSCPVNFKCISKVSNQNEEFYIVNYVNSSMETQNMSKDEWVKFATTKGSDTERIFVTSTEKWGALNFDWKALSEEYSGQKTQEEQAQNVIDSFSSLDENGEEVLDYPAFKQFDQQQQAEKEAKELEQKMRQEAKVTYSEQELGF